jgi:hypothetical protein
MMTAAAAGARRDAGSRCGYLACAELRASRSVSAVSAVSAFRSFMTLFSTSRLCVHNVFERLDGALAGTAIGGKRRRAAFGVPAE